MVKKDTIVLKQNIVEKDSTVKKHYVKRDSTNRKKEAVSALKHDSSLAKYDSSIVRNTDRSINKVSGIDLFRKVLLNSALMNFYGKLESEDLQVHKNPSRDGLFYIILALCFYFAFVRLFFEKYLNNIFSLFFRATMRQQQIREQALQMPLPSLLLNILFIFSSGLFSCFLLQYYQYTGPSNFWIIYIYCIIAITAIYVAKFLIIKLCGWIFNIHKAADNYLFIVFMVNKILGIGLLPFLMIIGFSSGVIIDIAIAIALFMMIILLLYRFITCFGVLTSEIKLNVFHYFIYLCAFEIAPLLLIYKVVLSFLKKAF